MTTPEATGGNSRSLAAGEYEAVKQTLLSGHCYSPNDPDLPLTPGVYAVFLDDLGAALAAIEAPMTTV